MSVMPDAAAWQRLGEMLQRRRIGLDRRYTGRGGLTAFTTDRGINYRVAWDIENAKRDNYTRATRREIEIAYELPARAIDEFLAGHDPAPAEATHDRRYSDPALQAIWEIEELDPDVRLGLIAWVIAVRQQQDANSESA